MQTISDTDAHSRFGTLLTEITAHREPITITHNGSPMAVLVAAKDYAAIEETLYLLSSPANSDRLRHGLIDFEAGNLTAGALCD